VLNFPCKSLQKATELFTLVLLIAVLIIVAFKRQQPVTAGDISRQREVKRQGVSSPFFWTHEFLAWIT
jgi:hypothetical protein